jgi:GPH family glycoside/pentoside/hexuronide:cation symporter
MRPRAFEEGTAMDQAQSGKLPIRVKLGFGVGDLGGNLYFTVIAFWMLNYLTDTVGISAGMAGVVVMIGKIWDAVTDPMMGYISDRTRTRWGRRRPYLLFGSFPWFAAMIFMFTNPRLESHAGLFLWGVIAYCLLSTAFTVVNVPYSSLTPELTKDYHERTSLNGFRSTFMVIGTLLGAGAALPLIKAFPNKNIGFTAMGAIFGALMMGASLITFFSVREPALPEKGKSMMGFFKTYLHVFKNKPFLVIVFTYMGNITAVTVVSGIMIYYFKYIFGSEGMTTVGLLILLVSAMLFIPLAVLVSRRIGKKTTYTIGMLIISAACIVIFLLGHVIGLVFVFIMMFIAGIGLSTTYPMPWSMVPDTVEYGYLQTGERREGGYYGLWTFISKIGQALAIALSGWILELSGYVPEVTQSASAQLGIRVLLGPVTAAIFVAAVVVLSFYPLNEKRYNEVLEKIKVMEGKGS